MLQGSFKRHVQLGHGVCVWILVARFWGGHFAIVLCMVCFQGNVSAAPGPPNWPIVGSLFYLSNPLHCSLEELAKKYGPIMYLRLGCLNQIVISNAEMAMEVLKNHDVDFASRPLSVGGKHISFDWNDIIFTPYGDHWRLLRKICTTKLLTKARLNSFELERQEEVAYMVENIITHCQEGKPVEVKPILLQLTTNNICRMLFGKRVKNLMVFLGKILLNSSTPSQR